MRRRTPLVLALFVSMLALILAVGCSPAQSGATSSATSGTSADSAATSSGADSSATAATDAQNPYAAAWAKRDGLTLKQVVAVSRHNMRAPLSTSGSVLAEATTPATVII